MSLVLHFNICQSADCKSFIFSETTGAYNVDSNPTGWGSPNAATGSASSATLIVTNNLTGVSYTINLFTEGFPSSSSDGTFYVTSDMIGGADDTEIDDGYYTFVYTVVIGGQSPVTYTQTVRQGFYCQVRCCVFSMAKDIDHECDCGLDQKIEVIGAFILLKGLEASANCGNDIKFNKDLAVLQKMCLNSGCTNCN